MTRKEKLAAEYMQCIGYDPFLDDPNLTEDEVETILTEWRAEYRESLK